MFFIPFIRFSYGSASDSSKTIYNYAITLLDEVMKNNNAFVAEEDGERFTSIYTKTFLQSSGSIYTAKRHARTLAEALPVLKDKVNICDLITITGIRIFYPKIYALIESNGNVLAGLITYAAQDEYIPQILDLAEKLDAIINEYDEQSNNGNYIRGMLILLFPKLSVAYKKTSQTIEHYQQCVEKGRICSAQHFELYFSVKYVTA